MAAIRTVMKAVPVRDVNSVLVDVVDALVRRPVGKPHVTTALHVEAASQPLAQGSPSPSSPWSRGGAPGGTMTSADRLEGTTTRGPIRGGTILWRRSGRDSVFPSTRGQRSPDTGMCARARGPSVRLELSDAPWAVRRDAVRAGGSGRSRSTLTSVITRRVHAVPSGWFEWFPSSTRRNALGLGHSRVRRLRPAAAEAVQVDSLPTAAVGNGSLVALWRPTGSPDGQAPLPAPGTPGRGVRRFAPRGDELAAMRS